MIESKRNDRLQLYLRAFLSSIKITGVEGRLCHKSVKLKLFSTDNFLSCSNVTNMQMFHVPRRMKDGVNLKS